MLLKDTVEWTANYQISPSFLRDIHATFMYMYIGLMLSLCAGHGVI